MLVIILSFTIFVIYWYVIRIWRKLGFYKAQGVHIIDGAYTPVLGNLPKMLPMIKKAMAGTGDRSNGQVQLVRGALATNGLYNSKKGKAAMVVYGTSPVLVIADPEMVQDLYTKKNSIMDKTGQHQYMFEDLLGKSFVFSKGD